MTECYLRVRNPNGPNDLPRDRDDLPEATDGTGRRSVFTGYLTVTWQRGRSSYVTESFRWRERDAAVACAVLRGSVVECEIGHRE